MAAGQGHGDVDLVVIELLLVVILLGPGGGGPPAIKYLIVFVSFICKMTPGSGSGIRRVTVVASYLRCFSLTCLSISAQRSLVT